jgi:hypothetical protein
MVSTAAHTPAQHGAPALLLSCSPAVESVLLAWQASVCATTYIYSVIALTTVECMLDAYVAVPWLGLHPSPGRQQTHYLCTSDMGAAQQVLQPLSEHL